MDKTLIDAVCAAADAADIPRAALLAVIQIESAGAAFEEDGRTPRFLFERHVFHRELEKRAPEKLQEALRQGLALASWSPDTQYKDQGSSSARLSLIARARAVHEDCANRSCSWGLGQTMGFHAESLGYANATAMVAALADVSVQIAAMVGEIKKAKLVDELQNEDDAGFARGYNGSGYKRNSYDTKLAVARAGWEVYLAGGPMPGRTDPLKQKIPAFELRGIQQRLLDLGYTDVGQVDGKLGRKTIGALTQFQALNGLEVDGIYGPKTKAALASADAVRAPTSVERLTTTAADLRAQGSGTIKMADRVGLVAKGLLVLGVGGAGEQAGLLDGLKGAVESAQQIRPLVDGVADLVGWATANWSALALAAGIAGAWYAWKIVQRRVDQYRADANV